MLGTFATKAAVFALPGACGMCCLMTLEMSLIDEESIAAIVSTL